MKKLKSFLAVTVILIAMTGCSNPYQEQISTENLDAKYGNHEIISLSAAAAKSESKYTVEDLRNLQDFLLVRETPDLSGKDYDLNNDDRWDVFDLCLMRRELLGSIVNDDIPIVYMTKDISSEGLMNTYLALEWNPSENTAVKFSTGEPPASNYLRPELIKDVVQYVDGTIVECNTAYGGSRSSTAMHYQVAKDHGFTEIADFQILDENGSMTLPVEDGSVLTENYVGAAFADYDSYLIFYTSLFWKIFIETNTETKNAIMHTNSTAVTIIMGLLRNSTDLGKFSTSIFDVSHKSNRYRATGISIIKRPFIAPNL